MSITEICFLRLSAKDANWIREKFRNLPPGRIARSERSWCRAWKQMIEPNGLKLHDNPLKQIDSDEPTTTEGTVFLKWLTLRLLIKQVNPNNLIRYMEEGSYFAGEEQSRVLLFIPYNLETKYSRGGGCSTSMGLGGRTDYYIPSQGNFLFFIRSYFAHYMRFRFPVVNTLITDLYKIE